MDVLRLEKMATELNRSRFTVEQVSEALDRVGNDFQVEGARLAVLTEDRYRDVLQIVGDNFLPDEAISIAYGLDRCPEWDDIVQSCLRQNLSVMMLHETTGDVIGVQIITISSRESPCTDIKPSPLKDVFTFLAENELKSDLFNKAGVDEFCHFFLIAVSRKYRQLGLGTTLMGACIALGKELGFKAVDSQATSNYSQKIFKRYGFEVLLQVPYDTIQLNGEPLRNLTNEHVSSQIVIKKLNQ